MKLIQLSISVLINKLKDFLKIEDKIQSNTKWRNLNNYINAIIIAFNFCKKKLSILFHNLYLRINILHIHTEILHAILQKVERKDE